MQNRLSRSRPSKSFNSLDSHKGLELVITIHSKAFILEMRQGPREVMTSLSHARRPEQDPRFLNFHITALAALVDVL